MLSDLIYRLRSLFRRSQVEAELDDELRYHLDRHAEQLRQSGLPPEEAMRQARLRFGGPEQIRQQVRDSRGTGLLEDAWQDIRYGMRTLISRPGFSLVVVLTLALGIGSCTAIFSVMNAVLFPALPYGDTSRLVYLYTPLKSASFIPLEITPIYSDYFDVKRQSRSYASTTAFQQWSCTLGMHQVTTELGGLRIEPDFFATLSVHPELGRSIQEDDNQPGHDHVVLISHGLWQQLFSGSADVLSKSLQLDGSQYRIIGVMPEGFQYPRNTEVDDGDKKIAATDVWTPLALTPQQKADRGLMNGVELYALARLKPGVSVAHAQAEMNTLMLHVDKLHDPGFFHGFTAYVKPFRDTLVGTARPLMWLLFGSVVFVLLIACGNAANLLLARGANRTHELGMRATLGAARGRLIRQMLTESLLLGGAGGVIGIACAYGFLKLLLALDPGNIPRLQHSSIDFRVLAFTLAVTLLTSLLTGIMPAFSSSRINLMELLKSGSQRGAVRTHTRLNSSLIVGEVALVVVLLAGAGLFLRSYQKVEAVPTGFSASTVSMQLDIGSKYREAGQRRAFFHTLVDRLKAVPEMQSVGISDTLPLSNHDSASTFWLQGYANQKGQWVETRAPSPGYFAAMGTPLIQGRYFTDDDTAGHPGVAIVNEAFVKKYLPGQNPIGHWITTNQPDDPSKPFKGDETIVGVIADVRHANLEDSPSPQLYYALWQRDISNGFIAIRSLLPANEVTAEAKSVLKQIDPTLSFTEIHTMGELVSEASARRLFQTTLLAIFASMALLLALIGLYGLLAYSVRQRTAEMGVRLALGASRSGIMRLVLRQGITLVGTGLVLGMAGAFAFSRLLTSFLYGVDPVDPLTFSVVPLLLLLAAIAACLIPGWRAASIDPVRSLRYE